jgi:hypothetical protein
MNLRLPGEAAAKCPLAFTPADVCEVAHPPAPHAGPFPHGAYDAGRAWESTTRSRARMHTHAKTRAAHTHTGARAHPCTLYRRRSLQATLGGTSRVVIASSIFVEKPVPPQLHQRGSHMRMRGCRARAHGMQQSMKESTHTYRAYSPAQARLHKHTCARVQSHTYILTGRHAHAHTHAHTHTHTKDTHTDTHAHTHTHTRTHAHTHTHTLCSNTCAKSRAPSSACARSGAPTRRRWAPVRLKHPPVPY